MPERVQKPFDPAPWGPKQGDEGGPGSPDISRPDTKDLLKKMRKVEPNQSKPHAERTGKKGTSRHWRSIRIFREGAKIFLQSCAAKVCCKLRPSRQSQRAVLRSCRANRPPSSHSRFPAAFWSLVIGARRRATRWFTIAQIKFSK